MAPQDRLSVLVSEVNWSKSATKLISPDTYTSLNVSGDSNTLIGPLPAAHMALPQLPQFPLPMKSKSIV